MLLQPRGAAAGCRPLKSRADTPLARRGAPCLQQAAEGSSARVVGTQRRCDRHVRRRQSKHTALNGAACTLHQRGCWQEVNARRWCWRGGVCCWALPLLHRSQRGAIGAASSRNLDQSAFDTVVRVGYGYAFLLQGGPSVTAASTATAGTVTRVARRALTQAHLRVAGLARVHCARQYA